MISIYLYIEITLHVVTSKKEVVTVFDLGGYLRIEKNFLEQPYHHYLTEKKSCGLSQEKEEEEEEEEEINKNHSKKKLGYSNTICRIKSTGY